MFQSSILYYLLMLLFFVFYIFYILRGFGTCSIDVDSMPREGGMMWQAIHVNATAINCKMGVMICGMCRSVLI